MCLIRPKFCELGQLKLRPGKLSGLVKSEQDLKAGTVPRLHAGFDPRPTPQLYHQKNVSLLTVKISHTIWMLSNSIGRHGKERAFLAKKGALRWEHAACPSAFQLIHPSEETCMFQLSIQTFPWFWCIRQTRQVALHVIRMWLLHAHGEIRHRFSYWHVLATSIGIKACMRSALCFGK